jgi:hypothetical protein
MRGPLDAQVRRVSWLLQSVRIRQTARKAFDLTRLGTGPAERLISAMVLGAAFFFVVLLLAHLVGLGRGYVVGLALVAFVTVMATSAVLVLWKSDAELEEQAPRLREELGELRVAALEAKAQREAEEALRAAEREVEEERRAAERAARPRYCPYCKEVIQKYAVKCRHCGEILDEELRAERRPQHWNPGVAAVLSFLWPGVGQMYKGQILNGFAWMFVVALGYGCCLVPGFILHVLCVFGAASGSE